MLLIRLVHHTVSRIGLPTTGSLARVKCNGITDHELPSSTGYEIKMIFNLPAKGRNVVMVVCKRDKDVELRFYRVKYTRCFRVKWPYLKYEFKTRGWKEFSISGSCARKCFV